MRPMALWTEREHRMAGVNLLRQIGGECYALSDHRTRAVAPGLPDIYILHRRIGGAWWEAKTVRGVLSPEQILFRERCIMAGVPHITGCYEELGRWLYDHGLLGAVPL